MNGWMGIIESVEDWNIDMEEERDCREDWNSHVIIKIWLGYDIANFRWEEIGDRWFGW